MSVEAWLCLLVASAAADDAVEEEAAAPVMDMEFLEYLGSWEGSDDEWLMFEDRAPRDDDNEENDDEPNERATEPDDADAQ